MRMTTFLLPVIAASVAVVLSSVFVVDEREKALVLQHLLLLLKRGFFQDDVIDGRVYTLFVVFQVGL